MKRSSLRSLGKSERSKQLRRIQDLLRQIAIKRDGGCILCNHPETGRCGGYTSAGRLILQAEHLVSRSNMATFGDMRNIVCLCQRHHIFWKPQNSQKYWELIEKIIGTERWAWYLRARDDKRAYKVDLTLLEIGLTEELKTCGQPTLDVH